jgi:sugar phosphate isomerase/epimerase
MGHESFVRLLKKNEVKLGGIACYRLGPFGLQKEMRFAAKVGGRGVVLVCGARGPKNLSGSDLKSAVASFVEQLKPHVATAEETGCVIAVENHANSLIESPDSIRWFGEMAKSNHLGIALAPHHLPQNAEMIGKIARDLGAKVKFFYAQQHGMGSKKKLPKEQEILQMPGRGSLDFTPILAALKKINYRGDTEIFMHPVPRGIPILNSTREITAEINRSRNYLDSCLKKIS